MQIKVNGEIQQVSEQINLTQLLNDNQVDNPDMVSVQVNGEFIAKEDYASTILSNGVEVDFLYFMGGGQ